MHYNLSEAQQLLQITSRQFLQDRFPWERLYAIESGESPLTREEVDGFADLGWTALVAPEAAGGGGTSLLEAAVVVEELGYAAVPAPVAVSNVAAHILEAADADDQLAALASNRERFTISEASRRARPAGAPLSASAGKLSGTLSLVPFAAISDVALAPLTVEGRPAFAALPLREATLEPRSLLDRMSYAAAWFDGAPFDEAQVLAIDDRASALHERCDALLTALTTIEIAGMMRRVQELTAEYITRRVQFGQPIAKFQAARHRASELLMAAEMTRWAAYHALWRYQEDPHDTDEIWLAKHYASRAVDRVYQHSHMLHGGVGVGMEYPLHLFTQGMSALAVRNGSLNELTERAIDGLNIAS